MKRIYAVLIIVIVLALVISYSVYYYIVNNITYKFTGFGISQENIGQITDKIELDVLLTNNSNLSFSVSNFNLKIVNDQGNKIGSIETIRSIKIPANGSNNLKVEVRNIDEMQLATDLLKGEVTDYRIKVSGLLAGFLPIAYSARVF